MPIFGHVFVSFAAASDRHTGDLPCPLFHKQTQRQLCCQFPGKGMLGLPVEHL